MRFHELLDIVKHTTGRARNVSSRSIRHMCKIMRDNEEVIAASPAKYKLDIGMIVISNQRILFCSSRFLGDVSVVEFGLNAVSAVSYTLGMTKGIVSFRIAKDDVVLEKLSRRAATTVANSVQLAKSLSAKKPKSGAGGGQRELDQVERLFDLYQCGALTDDEFHRLKGELFASDDIRSTAPAYS